jgi:predicted peptidase
MSQTAKKISVTKYLNYLEFLPKYYETDKDKKYPLVIFLHGAGERGSDLEKVKTHGIPMLLDKKPEVLKDYDYIYVSPQCPEQHSWAYMDEEMDALMKNCIENLRVDTQRIYMTGLSMGGFGTWTAACRHPNMFAAVAPICGGSSRFEDVSCIKDLPIWVFHGAKDGTVPLSRSAEPVAQLNEFNTGNVKFTVYPDLEHDSWTVTYENPKFYEWLFSQTNSNFKF